MTTGFGHIGSIDGHVGGRTPGRGIVRVYGSRDALYGSLWTIGWHSRLRVGVLVTWVGEFEDIVVNGCTEIHGWS